MIQCLERKVFLFNPKETPPTEEDAYIGFVLALTKYGYWENEHYMDVRNNPEYYRAWMQYPDLVKHKDNF